MQSHHQQNEKGKSEPTIRPSVLCAVLGGALVCILAITASRYKKGDAGGTDTPSAHGPDSPPAPLNPVRVARRSSETASPPGAASNSETALPAATEIAGGISNELVGAREKLADLRDKKHYGDKHPEVQKQAATIESLEQSAAVPPEFLGLARARAELAALRVGFGESHPDVQEQQRVIESFEHSAVLGERLELADAKAELQRLRARFSDTTLPCSRSFRRSRNYRNENEHAT